MAVTDFSNQCNKSGICYQSWGAKEPFLRGELADEPMLKHPRWFHFGNEFPIEVAQQIDIVQNLTGDCEPGNIDACGLAILPMYQIRQQKKLFKSFFLEESNCIPFQNYNSLAIASKFIGL